VPIRRELLGFYAGEWRTYWRPRLIERSGDKCESCGVPNGCTVLTMLNGLWYDVEGHAWRAPHGKLPHDLFMGIEKATMRWKRVRCGGAHLDHDPTHNTDENLRWWCGRCHLLYDMAAHRETRLTRKDAKRPLLADLINQQQLEF
jgi:hypothetical protein